MKIPLNPCFILHRRAYRETSMILEVFAREHGRLSIMAKGVKGNKKGQASIMQVANRLKISWSIHGEMGTLTGVEAEKTPYKLTGREYVTIFYLNELLLRLLHKHEAHPELFDAYATALERLGSQGNKEETLRVFEKNLLQSIGYGLVLDHDVETGESIDSDKEYLYLIDRGPVLKDSAAVRNIRISGKALVALDNENFKDKENLKDAKKIMRFVIDNHLGDRPLASRKLYQDYLRQSRSS